jgi:hypothetical protein
MICTRPPKKKAAGSTMGVPAAFSSPVWYMPSMNDVVANAVTAHAAGSAIRGGAAGVTRRSWADCCPSASGAVMVRLLCRVVPYLRHGLCGRAVLFARLRDACSGRVAGLSLPRPPSPQERGPSARMP